MIDFILEEEFNKLKQLVETNKLSNEISNNFMEDYNYEYDFSHNEIEEMQKEFVKIAKEYLMSKCKEQYIIYYDWAVHICSVDFFNKNLKNSLYVYEKC